MFSSEEDESAAAQKLADFLFDSYADDIYRILLDDDPSKLHFPLVIECVLPISSSTPPNPNPISTRRFAELMELDPKFAGKLYLDPHKYLPFLKDAAQWAQDKVLKKLGNSKTTETKKSVHVRIDVTGSPLESPEVSPSIGKVRVKHMRKLIALKGTVIRSGGVKMIEYERCYMCRKCKHSFEVYPELEARNRINLPPLCPKGGCTSSSFQFVEGSTICHDYQEIKIQENVQLLGIGSIPRSMPVILMDDLVDGIKAGDDVIVTGILSAKWSPDIKDVRSNLDPMLLANYVRRTNELKADVDISAETGDEFECFWEDHAPLQGLSVNTTLSGPLLSRFDIVLVLLDTQNTDWDEIVSSHILKENLDEKKDKTNASGKEWTLPKLRRYINYVRRQFKPVLTKEAERVISSYYQLQRKSGTHNAARTTVRMLESLIRLAQAHARLMFRNEVRQLDAIAAILCMESSMTTSPIVDIVGNALHSNFTDDPDEEYKTQEKKILKKLGLTQGSP